VSGSDKGVRLSDREQHLAAVRALIAAEPVTASGPLDRADRLRQLCRASARTLPALGSAVTVMTAQGAQPGAVASDAPTRALEEQQFSLGEGPCIDAFAQCRPVLVPDLERDRLGRWFAYTPAALAKGVRAVFAFPLQMGAARLGVLNVYRDTPGVLSAAALNNALTFAEIALWILVDGPSNATVDRPVAGLESAVESRSELFQAQGMVKIQLGVSLAEAMSRLRAHAYTEDRRLADVARDVVARRLVLESDRIPGDSG
jgi:hypothetical protein